MLQGAGDKKEELKEYLNKPQSRESIKQVLLTRKTMERLTEIAKASTEVQAGKKEEKK